MGKLVDSAGGVGRHGSAVLAFIDTIEEAGHRWRLSQQLDGSYEAAVLASGVVFVGRGDTLEEAVKAVGREMIAHAMGGAADA